LNFSISIPALSKTAASMLESVLTRDPHEAEFIVYPRGCSFVRTSFGEEHPVTLLLYS
jgi:hypothetical protein